MCSSSPIAVAIRQTASTSGLLALYGATIAFALVLLVRGLGGIGLLLLVAVVIFGVGRVVGNPRRSGLGAGLVGGRGHVRAAVEPQRVAHSPALGILVVLVAPGFAAMR